MNIIVEYSKEQNAFHRCPIEERENNEARLLKEGKQSSYLVIGQFPDYDSADQFIEENYDLIKERRMFKNDKGELFAI